MKPVASVTSFVLVPFLIASGAAAQVKPPSQPAPQERPRSYQGLIPESAKRGGTSYYEFMQTLTWGKKEPVEMCTGILSCIFHAWRVHVNLEPVAGAYVVDPRAVPPGGAVVMQVENIGDETTRYYKFRPGFTYSVEVHPDRSPNDTLSHWVLKETSKTTHLTDSVPGETGPYYPCKEGPAAKSDRVGLYKCGQAHASSDTMRSSTMGMLGSFEILLGKVAAGLLEAPLWKSCPWGCCTLGPY